MVMSLKINDAASFEDAIYIQLLKSPLCRLDIDSIREFHRRGAVLLKTYDMKYLSISFPLQWYLF